MTKTFVHVGAQPILFKGEWFTKGRELTADPKDVEFFIAIGALEEKPVPSAVPVPPLKGKD